MDRQALGMDRPWSKGHRGAQLSACAILMAGLWLFACSEPGVSGPGHYNLVDEVGGALQQTSDDFTESVLLDEDFSAGAEGWTTLFDLEDPLAGDDELKLIVTGSEGPQSFASLGHAQGAICRVIKVKPLTVYAFKALARVHDVVPQWKPFSGAAPHLIELTRFDSIERLFSKSIVGRLLSKIFGEGLFLPSIERVAVGRQYFKPGHQNAGWKSHRRVFRTGPKTQALLIGCELSLNERLESGSIDYTDVELREVSSRRLQEELLQADVKIFGLGEPALQGWHKARRVKALIGSEVRPAVVLFPGESVSFELIIPTRQPVFQAGVGAWRPALKDHLDLGLKSSQHLRVAIGDRVLLDEKVLSPAALVDARWQDLRADLSDWAGEGVLITLSNAGDLPGVFGAPKVRETAPAGEQDKLNLLLFSIDTLRADHLGSYGYHEQNTPRLDALAAEGIRYSSVDTQAPWTLPSHASMFSGQFSSVHGVNQLQQVLSSTRSPLLARKLSERGYQTQAFTGGGFVNPDFGFDKGFDGFRNVDPLRPPDASFLLNQVQKQPERYSKALIAENGPEAIKEWLTQNGGSPFFLFIHTYMVHDYDPPADFVRCPERGCTHPGNNWWRYRLKKENGWKKVPFSEEDRAHLNHNYDDTLRYVDLQVGDILDHLKAIGLADNTVVAVASDHGEEMLERGFVQHGKRLYEEGLRIPMILRIPGQAPRVDTRPVMQIDLMPTLLSALSIPLDARSQGIDLLAPDAGDRIIWSEVNDILAERYTARTADGLKIIHSPPNGSIAFPNLVEWEFYDLSKDAAEMNNLAKPGYAPFEAMRRQLESHKKSLELLSESMESVGVMGELSSDIAEQLKVLGYVDGTGEEDVDD